MRTFLIPASSEEQAWFLAADQTSLSHIPDSPFHGLVSLSRADLAASRGLEASDRRLQSKHFVSTFEWAAVRPLLPLRLAIPPDVPPWQPRRCRSYYNWLPQKRHSAPGI